MPGPTESPGKSISTPQVMMPPTDQTRDEGHNMSFYCRAGGNPTPSVEWRLKGRKLLSGAKYLVRDGELVVRNLNYNDTGQYTCAEKNTLGSSDASGNLTVRSKKNIFFFYGKQPFKQDLLKANLAVLMASAGPSFMASS